jgi:hypothetical protein
MLVAFLTLLPSRETFEMFLLVLCPIVLTFKVLNTIFITLNFGQQNCLTCKERVYLQYISTVQ